MNIFEEDTISVKSKKQAAEHIVRRYGDFGWKLTEKNDDRLYEDVTHMTFTRPHFLENRDKLQLLQVRLEIAYNNMGKLSSKSRVRASLFSSLFALLCVSCVAGGLVLILLLDGLLPIIFGSLFCVVGLAVCVLGGIFSHRIYRKDKKKYGLLIQEQLETIDGLCRQARSLRGENE